MNIIDRLLNPIIKTTLLAKGSKKIFEDEKTAMQEVFSGKHEHHLPEKLINSLHIDNSYGCPIYTVGADNNAKKCLIYLHGGAFCQDIASKQFRYIDNLYNEIKIPIYVVIYPKIPQNNFRDVERTLNKFYNDIAEKYGSENVFIAGDSSGGTIALTFAAMQEKKPGGLILYSPLVDIRLNNALIDDIEPDDPMLSVDGLKYFINMWIDGENDETPRVNPAFIDVLSLPRTLIFTGTDDILSPDAINLGIKIIQAGGQCHLNVFENLSHTFFFISTPAGKNTINITANFIKCKR